MLVDFFFLCMKCFLNLFFKMTVSFLLQKSNELNLLPINVGIEFGNLDSIFLMNKSYL